MLVPYNTDAPIYHFPLGTIGLIVANVFIWGATMESEAAFTSDDPHRWLLLEFNAINPIQWLTNNFMHAGLMHLAGNMLFLWVFGLVVEGKLGWIRFVPLYLTIGIFEGAAVQISMFLLSVKGASLGASGVIFGLLGIAVLWAPKNNVSCVFWFMMPRFIEVPMVVIGAFYFVKEAVVFIVLGYEMSSEALHLTGLVIGVPFGLLLLKMNWVDCEGWDLLSIYIKGAQGKPRQDSKRQRKDAVERETQRETNKRARDRINASIVEACQAEQHDAAIQIFRKHSQELHAGKQLTDQALTRLADSFQKQKQWSDVIPLLVEIVDRFSAEKTIPTRIKLAQILVQADERPRQAIAVLKKLPRDLPEKQRQRVSQIVNLAKKQIQDGAIEIDVMDW